MGRKEKPIPIGNTRIPTIGDLLRRFRNEHNLSLVEMSVLTSFSSSHLSNVENGRAQPSKDLLADYEEHLGLKLNEIGAFFLLFHTETISIDSLLTGVSQVDLNNAREITRVLDSSPLLLEKVATFIKKTRCGLSGYLELYQPQITDLLRRYNRPSLVVSRLQILLENQSQRDG